MDNVQNTINFDSLSKKGKERYHKIIEAATDVFLEQGFINANMNEIVKRAGGSLTTLYKIFENKHKLFSEVLRIQSNELLSSFEYEKTNDDDIKTILYNVGINFVKTITQDKMVSFYRLMVIEGYKNDSEIGKIFFNSFESVTRDLSIIIENKMVFSGDSKLAANQFLELVKEPIFTYCVLSLKEHIDANIVERDIKQAIEIFVNGIKNYNINNN